MKLKLFACIGIYLCLFAIPAFSKDSLTLEQLKKMAAEGDSSAQGRLGSMYLKGEGVSKDTSEGVKWMTLAAQHGNCYAEFCLGCLYGSGEGVSKNLTEAIKWFTKAAEHDDIDAAYNLGCAYARGDGVSKNPTQAAKWFSKAAEKGCKDAQHSLSIMIYHAEGGLKKDLIESWKWTILSGTNTEEQNCYNSIKREMTLEQIAEATQRAEAFRKAHTKS